MARLRESMRKLTTPSGLKIVAFVAAILVWYVARAVTSNSVMIRNVPVNITTAADWNVVGYATPTVDITFLGSRTDLLLLHRDAVRVTLDLRNYTEAGAIPVTDKSLRVDTPGNARVDQIRPAHFEVRIAPARKPAQAAAP